MRTNEELQRDVQDALLWEPLLKGVEVGVTAHDGVITLTGIVDNYSKKMMAEHASRNVSGVRGIVENIEIRPALSWNKSDNEIAAEAVRALERNWAIPNDSVQIVVKDAWITLEGTLHWEYQRIAVADALAHLPGVKGLVNNTVIVRDPLDAVNGLEIERAMRRHWSLNATDIMVIVSGMKVTLLGTVASVYQKDAAGVIAGKAPGVLAVENDLVVDFDYALPAGVSRPL